MFRRINVIVLFCSVLVAACGVEGDIQDAIETGQCRQAEALVEQEFKGQKQLYERAMIYIRCDKQKTKGIRTLQKLANGDYIPALERLIEYDVATAAQQKRYRELKDAIARAAYERRQRQKQRLLSYGKTTTKTQSRPRGLDNNKCIQDGGTLMCYNRQSQRYGNW